MHTTDQGTGELPRGVAQIPGTFFRNPTHGEALARLHYLADQRRSLGILSGASGSGKTTVLAEFERQLRCTARPAATVNLVGQEAREFLWSLAAELGASPELGDARHVLWRRVSDRVEQNHLDGTATVLLLDDADRAARGTLVQVERIVKTYAEKVTVILGADVRRVGCLGSELLELSQLRIALEPWDKHDVRAFLDAVIERSSGRTPRFDDGATARLSELSGGTPRWVSHLAELAVLAAQSRGRDRIDAETIESVYLELSDTYADAGIPVTA